jgi:23S rRNA pseudouridine1911/1915/1917 synthase
MKQRFEVAGDDIDLRLDQLLAKRIDDLSRRRARVLIDIGGVFVDGKRVKVASRRLAVGQVVEAVIGPAFDRAHNAVGEGARRQDAEALPDYSVVYEDADVVVVDKPVGLLAAPTPEGDRGNLADLLSRRGGGRDPIWVVHRIDLPTSGLLVYAKSERANRSLSDLFRDHAAEREYAAVVVGDWPEELLSIDEPVGGKPAVTRVSVVRRSGGATALAVVLETGRTHQIRIHCAGAGFPIAGDRRYGRHLPKSSIDIGRMALHARVLGFAHPVSGEVLRFESELPAVMEAYFQSAPWAG